MLVKRGLGCSESKRKQMYLLAFRSMHICLSTLDWHINNYVVTTWYEWTPRGRNHKYHYSYSWIRANVISKSLWPVSIWRWSFQAWDFHYKDKTVMSPSYLIKAILTLVTRLIHFETGPWLYIYVNDLNWCLLVNITYANVSLLMFRGTSFTDKVSLTSIRNTSS